MKTCERKPWCMFDAHSSTIARLLGRTYIRGRTYHVYHCNVCKRYVLCRVRAVRPMTDEEMEEFSEEVREESARLNGREGK